MANSSDTRKYFFEVMTPLDFTVRVTLSYWELIVNTKHPVMAGLENNVQETLEARRKLGSVEAIQKSFYFIEPNAQDDGFVLWQKS